MSILIIIVDLGIPYPQLVIKTTAFHRDQSLVVKNFLKGFIEEFF